MLLTSPSGLRSSSAVPFYLAAGTMSLVCASLISAIRLDSVQADDKTHPAHTVEAHAVEARPLAAAGPGKARQSKEQPAAAKTEPTEMLHYTGTVVDKDAGKGIPNATVIVRRFEFMSEGTNVLAETRHKTDAEGKYSFEIPPEQIAIPRMSIELHVAHDDYAGQIGFYVLSTIREKEALGERPSFERIELGLSEPITGTVVAPDGKPLGGVKIVGYSKVTPLEFPEPRSTAEAITDSSGKFRLNAVKRGKGVFWVVPTDYAETSREITEKHGDVGEIRLRPGVRASGRVLSAEGKPVAGVPVNILYTGGGSEITGDVNAVGTSVRRSAITDNDGHFAFDPLPTGDYWIAPAELKIDPTIGWDFRIRRYELPGAFLPVNVKIQEGVASAPIEIQALPHVIFNAQFLDSKGNKTSGEDVVVNMNGEMDGQYWFGEGRSNSDGTVSICIPHGMHVRLNMELAPRLRFRRGKGKDLENNVMFVDLGTLNDDVEGFEIIRYRETVVRVNAVDAEGKQVKVFRVAATYPWGSHVYSGSDLIFNRQDDGRYQATQMLPDEDVKFTVTAPGYEPASETVRLGEGESKDLVLMLKKATDSKRE